MLTTRPVFAAATIRSVCRDRNAGIWSTSATPAAGPACDGSWMSVRIGTRCVDFTAASVRSPSSSPGPRNDRIDVRFALSYDALKTNGTRARRAMSARRPASSIACEWLSMTHGPAMSTNGLPPPIVRSPSSSGFTRPIVSSDRLGSRARLRRRARLVQIGRFDEGREERMRARRLRLELRMELHGEVPRMAGQFGDLDELAVGGASRDPQAVLGERLLVQAVELVAMPMALVDQARAVHALRQRSGRELARVAAQPHRAAEIVDA